MLNDGTALAARPFHPELASACTRLPVEGAPCMVCQREYYDFIGLRPVEDRERETLHNDSTRLGARGRACEGKANGARCRLFYCSGEAFTQSGLRLIVVNNLGKKFEACRAINRARVTGQGA